MQELKKEGWEKKDTYLVSTDTGTRIGRYGIRVPVSADMGTKVQKMQNATFWRIKPIVPGFVRIGFRFAQILGRFA